MGFILLVTDVSLSKEVVVWEEDVDFTLNFIFSLLLFLRAWFNECAIDEVEVAPHSFSVNSLGDLSSYGVDELFELLIFFCDEIEYDVVFG